MHLCWNLDWDQRIKCLNYERTDFIQLEAKFQVFFSILVFLVSSQNFVFSSIVRFNLKFWLYHDDYSHKFFFSPHSPNKYSNIQSSKCIHCFDVIIIWIRFYWEWDTKRLKKKSNLFLIITSCVCRCLLFFVVVVFVINHINDSDNYPFAVLVVTCEYGVLMDFI